MQKSGFRMTIWESSGIYRRQAANSFVYPTLAPHGKFDEDRMLVMRILRREGIFIVCFEQEVTSLFKTRAPLFSHHEIFPEYPISLINAGAELQFKFDDVVIVFEIPTDFNIVKGLLFPHS